MNGSVLSKVWYNAIMNSQEEVKSIGNLVNESTCLGLALIGGSTKLEQFSQFAFSDDYIPNTSGKL